MVKTNISKRVAVMALLIVSTFAVAGLTAVSFLSESFVLAQGLGNDPISSCFKTIGETEVKAGGIQNWTESIQNFVSLIPNDSTLKLINNYIVGSSGSITNMTGIWNVVINGNMTAHDRKIVFGVIDNILAAAQPGFTQLQQNALGRCITNEVNSLGPTPMF
jgi:hypothetical protein